MKYIALALALPFAAQAQEALTYSFDGSFEDATFAVENAILNQGLVIDHVSHVGEMLERTGNDLGRETRIFKNADVFLFCSAVISRQMMEADPLNIMHCPYNIFVMETADGVTLGHKEYPDGPMQVVENLMQEIIAEATGD